MVNRWELEEFNGFIDNMELIVPLIIGKRFTWYSLDGRAMSRLDRFFISESLVGEWKVGGQVVGSRDFSDHCPIWHKSDSLD